MKTRRPCFFLLLLLLQAVVAQAGAIRNLPGFTTTVYGPNDDGSYPCTGPGAGVPSGCTPVSVPIGFSLNFYGQTISDLYVNNNGNVTFDAALSDYTPFGLADTESQIVAPFFADVDTRAGNVVTFGNDTVDGHQAFGVDFIDVGYYATNTDKLNSFQVILIDRSDRNPGDFDIEFNYDQIQWETGDASGGVDGLGGDSAVAGFSDGSGSPGTFFQLQGSAIPGEFLDSNPGGLIHNDLNTNVLGRYLFPIVNLTNTVLNVERFSQGDPRWASDTYDDSNFTIQQKGCALSSLAMALNYAGLPTDPGDLNALMSADGDFVGTAVSWDAATRDASSDTLVFHAYRTSDIAYLSQTLAAGYPVIVGVNLNDQGAPGHFVLVIGEQNGQFLINDPGHADATTLDDYNNDFETRGYVGDPPGDVSGLDLAVGNAANILLLDPLGRRTGFDPASGMILQEIPQSVGFLDCIENSDLTGAPGTDTAHLVEIYQPLEGSFQGFLLGANGGSYQLTLRGFAPSGTAQSPLTLQGRTTPNATTGFQFNFAFTGTTWETFINEYPWSVSPTNGLLPLAVQFTAPNNDSAGNPVTNWYWNFGDGSASAQQNPSHYYSSGGTFFPTLAAIDDTGNTVVSLGPFILLPTLQFSANPTYGDVPLPVQFMATNIDSTGSPIANWNWSFGDGAGSTAQNPSHTYTTAGSFFPAIVATNDNGVLVSGFGPSITVSLPTVQYNANPMAGQVPLTVQFTSTNIDDDGNAIVNWNWDFGDGSTSTARNPSHIYATAGTFYLALTATNDNGEEAIGFGPPAIEVSALTVAFTANPTAGAVPLTVQFASTNIDDAGNTIVNWNWDFGDGFTSTAQNPSHVYTSVDTFYIALTATNDNGEEAIGFGPAAITVSALTVAFTANPTIGPAPLAVSFSSASVDSASNAIVNWNWDFGDGSTSTAQNPSHTYANTGTFFLALTATNNLGGTVLGSGPPYITATVAPGYSGLVLNGGFETGDFTGWTLAGPDTNDIFVDDGSAIGIIPHSGNYLAALGSADAVSYLSQTLATTAGAAYALSFWLNSPDGLIPNEFLVSWAGHTLFDAVDLPEILGWTNLQFAVVATGTSTVLQFGARDDPSYLGLDDISVLATKLGLTSVNLAGTNLVLNGFNGSSGGTYYVLRSPNLALPLNLWTPVATNVLTASGNFSITVTNTVTRNVPQEFYILETP